MPVVLRFGLQTTLSKPPSDRIDFCTPTANSKFGASTLLTRRSADRLSFHAAFVLGLVSARPAQVPAPGLAAVRLLPSCLTCSLSTPEIIPLVNFTRFGAARRFDLFLKLFNQVTCFVVHNFILVAQSNCPGKLKFYFTSKLSTVAISMFKSGKVGS